MINNYQGATLAGLTAFLRVQDKNDTFNHAFPKRWLVPNGYVNPRLIFLEIYCSAIVQDKLKQLPAHTCNLGMLYKPWKELHYPVYFVSPALMEAALATDPPLDMEVSTIKWPLDALVFMFPSGILPAYYGIIGKATGIDGKPGILTYISGKEPDGKLCVFFSKTSCLPGDTIRGLVNTPISDKDEYTFYSERDDDTNARLNKLVYNLVLIMTAQPSLVEHGACVRKGDSVKSKAVLWQPNYLGRTYKQRREAVAASVSHTHTSPRMHWRRGHYRHQRWGKGWMDVKVLWIEPVLVNAEQAAA